MASQTIRIVPNYLTRAVSVRFVSGVASLGGDSVGHVRRLLACLTVEAGDAALTAETVEGSMDEARSKR